MGFSKSILSYADCQAVLDQALNSERGVKVDFSQDANPRSSCTTFVHRCNQFRKNMAREALSLPKEDRMYGRTDYERLKIAKRPIDNPDHVIISLWSQVRVKVEEL